MIENTKLIVETFKTHWNGNDFDINFTQNITMLIGDSGTGKSYLADVFRSHMDVINVRVYDHKWFSRIEEIKKDVKTVKGVLFVIDDADILLDEELRRYICFDFNNQYLLIGKNPELLHLTKRNIKSLKFDSNRFYLQ